jgi:hypothetical protein
VASGRTCASSHYQRSDAPLSHMSGSRKNLAAQLRHISSRRLSRECYEASQHESGVAVLRRSWNTAMPLWYSGAVGCCFAVRLDQATSQRCSTTSLLGTVNRSVYNLNIVFYRLTSFETDAQKSKMARGSPRWWQVAAQQRLVVL